MDLYGVEKIHPVAYRLFYQIYRLDVNNFIGISCEISVQPLYKNEAKFLDIINYLNTRGYEIYSVHNSYYEINYGQTFSIDIVFIKKVITTIIVFIYLVPPFLFLI